MSGDGRPLSVRLHEEVSRLEATMPATAQALHEIVNDIAALEAPCACEGGKVLAEGWIYSDTRFDGSDVHIQLDAVPKGRCRVRIIEVPREIGWSDISMKVAEAEREEMEP